MSWRWTLRIGVGDYRVIYRVDDAAWITDISVISSQTRRLSRSLVIKSVTHLPEKTPHIFRRA